MTQKTIQEIPMLTASTHAEMLDLMRKNMHMDAFVISMGNKNIPYKKDANGTLRPTPYKLRRVAQA